MNSAYNQGYEAGEADAAAEVREHGAVQDSTEDGIRESALESYRVNGEDGDRAQYVAGYLAAYIDAVAS